MSTTDRPAEFDAIADRLRFVYSDAEVVNTGGGIDCIRIGCGHYCLYFGTAAEVWGASVYSIVDGEEVWDEDETDSNLWAGCSSDEPDAEKVAVAIAAAATDFYQRKYITPLLDATCSKCGAVHKGAAGCTHASCGGLFITGEVAKP